MKLFDKWLYTKFRDMWDNRNKYEQLTESTWLKDNAVAISKSAGISVSPQSLGHRLETSGLRFNLYKATGGFVIETQQYDSRTDRHQTHLYVVNSEKDIGQEISKIITLESLKS
jgi:hypothetical protein